jgi:uncharacterized membrane protein
MDALQVRHDLVHGESADWRRRRDVVVLSLGGMAALAPVVLLQTGVVKHLPDPPLPGFHSDQVNLSDEAYQFGVPDGILAMLSLAGNLVLAALGDRDRARTQPWVPLAAAAKAGIDAAVAAWYLFQEPTRQKAWCVYCIPAALANFGILAQTLPEALEALRAMLSPAAARSRGIAAGSAAAGESMAPRPHYLPSGR